MFEMNKQYVLFNIGNDDRYWCVKHTYSSSYKYIKFNLIGMNMFHYNVLQVQYSIKDV